MDSSDQETESQTVLSIDEFRDVLKESLEKEFPESVVTEERDRGISDYPYLDIRINNQSISLFLDNVYPEYLRWNDSEYVIQILINELKNSVEGEGILKNFSEVESLIIPVIRAEGFGSEIKDSDIYYNQFVGTTWKVYAVNYPFRIIYIQKSDMGEWNINGPQLDELAMKNLNSLKIDYEASAQGGINVIIAGDELTSSLIFMPDMLEEIAKLGGLDPDNFWIGVPSRDNLILINPQKYELEEIRESFRNIFDESSYSVSPDVFIMGDGQIKVIQ